MSKKFARGETSFDRRVYAGVAGAIATAVFAIASWHDDPTVPHTSVASPQPAPMAVTDTDKRFKQAVLTADPTLFVAYATRNVVLGRDSAGETFPFTLKALDAACGSATVEDCAEVESRMVAEFLERSRSSWGIDISSARITAVGKKSLIAHHEVTPGRLLADGDLAVALYVESDDGPRFVSADMPHVEELSLAALQTLESAASDYELFVTSTHELDWAIRPSAVDPEPPPKSASLLLREPIAGIADNSEGDLVVAVVDFDRVSVAYTGTSRLGDLAKQSIGKLGSSQLLRWDDGEWRYCNVVDDHCEAE